MLGIKSLTGPLWRHGDFLRSGPARRSRFRVATSVAPPLIFTAVLVLHATPLEVGVLGAAELLPDVLFGLVAGVWVDRLRRPLMIVADIGQFAPMATIPLAYAFDALTIGQVFAVAFVTGTFNVFFYVSYWTYLPTLVEKEHVLEGNSKMAATCHRRSRRLRDLRLAGTADSPHRHARRRRVVPGLRRRLDPHPQTGAGPAAGRAAGRRAPGDRRRRPGDHPRAGPPRHGGRPRISGFSFRVYGACYLLYATDVLGFKPGVLGLAWGLGGATSLVGAMYAGRAAARFGLGPTLTLGLVGMGLPMLLFPAAHDASIIALALLLGQQFGDGFFTVWDINQVSLRQSITPEQILGRVNAGFRFAGQGAMLAGALAGGLLGELIGLRTTLVFASLLLFLAASVVATSPAWSAAHHLPEPEPDALPAS